jgi:hypothetical protein
MNDQWVCTITGEVMDDFGNLVDEGSGDWVTDYENNDLCLGCNKPMWVEGYIGDDIQLCHLCYENQYTDKGQG